MLHHIIIETGESDRTISNGEHNIMNSGMYFSRASDWFRRMELGHHYQLAYQIEMYTQSKASARTRIAAAVTL